MLPALLLLAACGSRPSGAVDASQGAFPADASWVLTRSAYPNVRSVQTVSPFTLGITDANVVAKVRSDAPECRLNRLFNAVATHAIAARCTAEARNVRALPTLLVTCHHQDAPRGCVLQYTAELWGEGLATSTRAYDVKLFGRLAWVCPDDAHLEDAMEPTEEAKNTFAQMTTVVRETLQRCQ